MKSLTNRALNRARLERQWLTRRRPASAIEAVRHLVGLQAQQADAAYYQLWSRLRHFTVDELSTALLDRAVARVVLMRGTIHLAAADDVIGMRRLVQPYLDRTLFTGSESGKRLVGLDQEELVAAGRATLSEGPLANDDLARLLGQRFPDFDGKDLAYALRGSMPLIQTPPRGVWGRGGGLVYAAAEQWLEPPEVALTIDDLVSRYLAAFGPASPRDFQVWSQLSHTAEVFERLRPKLVSYRDSDGRELFDLPDTALPDPEQPLPPIMMGPFDNILLSHVDRTFVISKEAQRRVFTHNGLVRGTALRDGYVDGLWKATVKKRSASLRFELFGDWLESELEALREEGSRLLRFAAGDVPATVEFTI